MLVKLLVVEDEKSILKLLRTILTANKYEVVEASTGAEALSLITSHCPDLILLDPVSYTHLCMGWPSWAAIRARPWRSRPWPSPAAGG